MEIFFFFWGGGGGEAGKLPPVDRTLVSVYPAGVLLWLIIIIIIFCVFLQDIAKCCYSCHS